MRRGLILLLGLTLLLAGVAPAVGAKPTPETITVAGPFIVGSAEADALQAELVAFATQNRVEVVYEDFGAGSVIDVVYGPSPPDMIIVPQPFVLKELAPELTDFAEFVNPRSLRRDFGNHLIDVATVDGAVLGAPVKADLKSLVWYKPAEFEAMNYAIPQTFDELVALSDSMVANGQTPWCNYIASGFATGWMGTDWVEDLLLGAEGPDVYDQWVAHDVLFQDPRVEQAFVRYRDMINTAGYVFDRPNMLNVPFPFNAVPLGDGECLMHKQGPFFAAFVQDFGYDLAEFDTFKFPSVELDFADSAIGAGVYVAALNDRPVVRELARFMTSQRFGREALADLGGWILPNVRFDLNRYGDDLTRSFAKIVHAALEADLFRFDASDLMPAAVGAGTFWAGIVDLISGLETIPQILADIDASWPT